MKLQPNDKTFQLLYCFFVYFFLSSSTTQLTRKPFDDRAFAYDCSQPECITNYSPTFTPRCNDVDVRRSHTTFVSAPICAITYKRRTRDDEKRKRIRRSLYLHSHTHSHIRVAHHLRLGEKFVSRCCAENCVPLFRRCHSMNMNAIW